MWEDLPSRGSSFEIGAIYLDILDRFLLVPASLDLAAIVVAAEGVCGELDVRIQANLVREVMSRGQARALELILCAGKIERRRKLICQQQLK